MDAPAQLAQLGGSKTDDLMGSRKLAGNWDDEHGHHLRRAASWES
jgi:hypothetical protein